MPEVEALAQAALLNRAAYFDKVRDAQISRDRNQEQQAKILGYDISFVGYNVKHPDGTLGFAKAISNSSNLHKGAYVSLVRPVGTQTAIIDTVPRG
ncbi:hypothetical protein [Nostoc sp. DedQUE07]|uniref:hypothetical protein n=1 Tax=Nostoc sp. DedQUE07 TaxID=3075392 RepID=UPI002AD3F484|nr:hypothetical protein [Nostoc sp. DedQUE07]MDZ8131857.1 hypothetical protein [Nostoc sp. DedQUE07]